MSIEFIINMGGKKLHSGQQACWVHVDSFIKSCLKTSSGYKRNEDNQYIKDSNGQLQDYTTPARIKKVADDWSLSLDLTPKSLYGSATTTTQRRDIDRIFNLLVGKICEPYITSEYAAGGYRSSLTFSGETPMILLSSAASFYRLPYEWKNFLIMWRELEERYDLRPWTMYYLVMGMGNISRSEDKSKHWLTSPNLISPSPRSGHMPFCGYYGGWSMIKRMTNMNAKKLKKILGPMGMAAEYKAKKKLKVRGRDNLFAGAEDQGYYLPDGSSSCESWLRTMAKASGYWHKEVTKMPPDPWSGARASRTIIGITNFGEFIEKVVVPIDRKKR